MDTTDEKMATTKDTTITEPATEPDECPEDHDHEDAHAAARGLAGLLGGLFGNFHPMPELGRWPFVVIEMIPNPDGGEGAYALSISAGSGVGNRETTAAIVLDTAAHLNGMDPKALVDSAEEARAKAGLRSLREFAFSDAPDVEEPATALESESKN